MEHRSQGIQSASPRIRPVESCHIADLIWIGEVTNLSPWSAQNYIDEMKNSDSELLRLESPESTTIGFLVGRFVTAAHDEARTDAEIYNIAVIEHEQRRGYGQLLFDEFTRLCRQREAANIWLEVRESNQKAIDFYRRNGFELVQTRPHFYNSPREHALLMKLSLKKRKA
ncbi:MAG: ribosomal protein S18-alanine N-acetyltransferase [Pyrinomonadaceae bacterium]